MLHRFITGFKNQSSDDSPVPQPIIVRSASLADSAESFELNFDDLDTDAQSKMPFEQAIESTPTHNGTSNDSPVFSTENFSLHSDFDLFGDNEQPSLNGNGQMSSHKVEVAPYNDEKEVTIVSENGAITLPVEGRLTEELSPTNPSALESLSVDENANGMAVPIPVASQKGLEQPDNMDDQLLELVQQGNVEAIESLFNQDLTPHGLEVVEVYFRGDRLQITVESPTGAPQEVVEQTLRPWLIKLKSSTIRIVELFGQKTGEDLPLWRIEQNLSSLNNSMEGDDLALPSLDEIHAVSEAKQEEVAAFLAQYQAGERAFQKINLSEANLAGITLTLADLQEAIFTWADLSEASLYHVNLNYAKLRFANLTGAKLRSASLQGTDFTNANLTGADLSWSNLQGANLTGANLTDANLQNAVLERVVMPDGTLLD